MERFKNITIIFLLAVGLLASAASAKPASVLLQEGLYAEEIEGDLDAAIKIYEQVIAEAKETQRAAAQATYRIGMCYLKKGEQAKAAIQFGNLVSKFPDQKALIAKAQEHLAKLKPPVTITAGFGPVRKRIVNDDGVGKNFMLDLDTGSLFSVSDAQDKSVSLEDFILEQGIDVIGETKSSVRGLMGVDMVVIPIANERWDISPEDVVEGVSLGSPGRPVVMSGKGELPATFIFKTKQGNMGVLQILEVEAGKAPRHVRVRYKMLQEPGTVRPTFDFGPEVERIIYTDETGKDCFFDLDTGKAFSIPQGLTRSSDPEKGIPWILENGIDFVNCAGRLQLWDMVAVEVEGKIWDSEDAVEINSVLMRDPSKEFLPTEQEEYIITAPFIYAFETREGGIGLLQILEKRNTYLKIRYKMLQKPAKIAPVEVFGPAKVVVLYDIDHPTTTEKECAIDFDTGKLSKIPPQARRMPGDDLMKWLSGKGTDAVAEIAGKDRGLIGVYVAVKTMPPYVWDKISPTELRSLMVNNYSARQETTPMLLEDENQQVFAFITRDSGLGILQILDVDKSTQKVKFRYKMLRELPVRGDAAKAMKLLSGLKALMGGVVGAIESDDPNTALLLLDKLIAQSKQFKFPVKDTSVEAAVKAGLEMLDPLRDALERKQMGRAKSLLASLNQMGPAIESALEKEAEQQGQSKKKTSIDEKLRNTFIACGTLCDSIRNALDNDDFESAETLCKEVEKHIEKGLELTPRTELGPMLESLAGQFKVWHEAIKVKDKKKAIRLGEALNRAGGLISNFVLEEKPDTQK